MLVLDRVIARSTARRWAPLNRLALSEFLHAIADERRSEISRGAVVPRALAPPASTLDVEAAPHDPLIRERLHDELAACNTALHALAAELRDRLSVADRGAASRRAASRGAAAARPAA